MLDFSNLEIHLNLFDKTNKQFNGTFKIETAKTLEKDEFHALRAKVYAFTSDHKDDSKKENIGVTKVGKIYIKNY